VVNEKHGTAGGGSKPTLDLQKKFIHPQISTKGWLIPGLSFSQ
jgi:hypothetical protein